MPSAAKPKPKIASPTGLPKPKSVEIRCRNMMTKIYGDKKIRERCNAKLAEVFDGSGEIACWRCPKGSPKTHYEVRRQSA